jgi:hypothetical protein
VQLGQTPVVQARAPIFPYCARAFPYFSPIGRIEVGKSLQTLAAPVRPCPPLAGRISWAGRTCPDMSGQSNQWSRMGDTGSIRPTSLQIGTFWHGFPPRIPRTCAGVARRFPLTPAGYARSSSEGSMAQRIVRACCALLWVSDPTSQGCSCLMRLNSSPTYPSVSFRSGKYSEGCAHSLRLFRSPCRAFIVVLL